MKYLYRLFSPSMLRVVLDTEPITSNEFSTKSRIVCCVMTKSRILFLRGLSSHDRSYWPSGEPYRVSTLARTSFSQSVLIESLRLTEHK